MSERPSKIRSGSAFTIRDFWLRNTNRNADKHEASRDYDRCEGRLVCEYSENVMF